MQKKSFDTEMDGWGRVVGWVREGIGGEVIAILLTISWLGIWKASLTTAAMIDVKLDLFSLLI